MLVQIILLYSFLNSGDIGHANSIFNELENASAGNIKRYNIDATLDPTQIVNEWQTIQSSQPNKKIIIYAVGNYGIDALIALKSSINKQSNFIALGTHQFNDKILSLPLDYLAIPESAIITQQQRQYISSLPHHSLLFAVPTQNPSKQELEIAYNNWNLINKPSRDNQFIIVTLPGDAPDENNEMKLFTKDSAKKLFDQVYALWTEKGKQHQIFLQNGPRTGKFNPTNPTELTGAHQYSSGENPDKAIDYISKYFIQLLEAHNVPYQFFNFAFEKTEKKRIVHSVFKQSLYLLSHSSNNIFILPGESVSMLGQIPLYASAQQIIVFRPDSMNSSHENVLQKAIQNNYVSYFAPNNSGRVIQPQKNITNIISDAEEVAKQLLQIHNN